MAQNSKIEWTHHTANLWWGCTKVHEGCDHCYAETLSKWRGQDVWGNDKSRREIKGVWKDLAKFQQLAFAANEIHRVFVGSMMDIFEKPMPVVDSNGQPSKISGVQLDTGVLRNALFEAISMNVYPNLQFLFLTKRPSNINKYIPEKWKTNPPANVMFGTSVVNQKTADTLIPQLVQVKGKKFLSCEPLLGEITFFSPILTDKLWIINREEPAKEREWDVDISIDWVIVGGESGKGMQIRPMHPDWARGLRDECKVADIPFFFKQWGEWLPESQDTNNVIEHQAAYYFDEVTPTYRVGKHIAGAKLDGETHKAFPCQ